MTPERFRVVVSAVLIGGVGISAALIALGFALALGIGWQGQLLGGEGGAAVGTSAPTTNYSNLVARLVHLQPLAISQLGLLVLLATPITRVAASVIGFALERDRLYTALTLVVLGILLGSVFLLR